MQRNEIAEKIRAGATIIDVRTPDEYAEGRYRGAINIPVDELPRRLDSIGKKDAPVVVYCASGGRSAVAESILRSRGFTDVLNAGGIAGMP